MNKNDYIIRLESEKDHREAENLVMELFRNVYRPGCLEHYVLQCLRKDKDFMPNLCFVMEYKGKIIGQNIFCKSRNSCRRRQKNTCSYNGAHMYYTTEPKTGVR